MSLTPLQKFKLTLLREQIGDLTLEDALNLALSAEQIKRDCGFGDPASNHFAIEQQELFEMAYLLELEGNSK